MPRRAFVTGATGFIGRSLVKVLCDAGWNVRGLVPPDERGRPSPDPRMDITNGDITDRESLRGRMDDTDGVFHLAALVASWIPDEREFFRVNVGGTQNVVAEALRSGVPRFLFTSSLSGIGVQPGEVMREDSPPGKVFGPYERSKAEAERLVEKAAREQNLPAIILIPGVVIGPGDTGNTGKFLLSFVRGELPARFAERSTLPVVGVDDVARAHLLAYERGEVGSRYIISGENVTWGDLMQRASAISGTPVPKRRIGPMTLRLVSRASEMRARLTGTPPLLPGWLADFMLTGAAMDNSKSVRELGLSYAPIENALGSAVDWFRQEGWLNKSYPEASNQSSRPLPTTRVAKPPSR